ncbi:MAG: hypothetical protein ACI4UA_03065, partial [Bacteroidaceae bacterium]
TFATEDANVCDRGCKRLRDGLQTFASKTGKMGRGIYRLTLDKYGQRKNILGNAFSETQVKNK